MDNIYTTSTELSWKVFIKYYIITILLGILSILLRVFGIINIDAESMYNIMLSILYVLIIIQIISPRLNKCIINEISFRSESLKTIIIPILAAIGTRLLTDILQILPEAFGESAIGIAKGQLDMSTYNPIERMFVGTILGPYFEELLFRVVFFTSITYLVGYIDTKLNSKFSSKILNLKNIFCWVLIIIDNILFSLSHKPDVSNFHLYFIGGLIDTIIYVKFGFYSSWLSHGLYNYFNLDFIFRWLGII